MRKVVLFGTNRGGGSPAEKLLLDEYPNAAAAYSLRALSTATVDSAVVRVRRSSDNVEQDFTATEITDGTLTTFTGDNDGFVTTWYDQSGNGNNAVQASATRQGKIVSSGLVNLTNGKPSVDFDGSNDAYSITSFNFNNTGNYQSFVGKRNGANQYLIGLAGNQYNVTLWNDNLYYIQSDTGGYLVSNSNDFTSDQLLITGLNNGSTQEAYKNSNLIPTSFVSFGLGSSVNSLGSYGNNELNGQLQEAIFWNTDQSANRIGIETNINTEYTIY